MLRCENCGSELEHLSAEVRNLQAALERARRWHRDAEVMAALFVEAAGGRVVVPKRLQEDVDGLVISRWENFEDNTTTFEAKRHALLGKERTE